MQRNTRKEIEGWREGERPVTHSYAERVAVAEDQQQPHKHTQMTSSCSKYARSLTFENGYLPPL